MTHALQVDGSSINNSALATILFPQLTYVLLSFAVTNSGTNGFNVALTYIDAHSLAYVGSYFDIQYCTALTALNMASLAFVGGNTLGLNRMSSLTSLVMKSLTYVAGYIGIFSITAATLFSFPILTYVGQYVQIIDNHVLQTISAPALTTIKCNSNSCGSYAVYFCGNAATLSISQSIAYAAASMPCFLTSSCTATTCPSNPCLSLIN